MYVQKRGDKVMKKWIKLAIYLIIAFILPLIYVVMRISPEGNVAGFIAYGIVAASPTIAAVIVFILNRELKDALSGLFQKKYIIRAIILPIIITCLTMLICKLLYCLVFKGSFSLNSVTGAQIIIISWALIAEEIGWRGFLEPHLRKMSIPKVVAPAVVVVVWSLWHYYLFLQGRMDAPIVWFFVGCIVESYIYSSLMRMTGGNIVSAMMYHFMWNLMLHICAINPSDNGGSTLPYMILILLEIPVGIILIIAKRRIKIVK